MRFKKAFYVLPIIILAVAVVGVVLTRPANSLTMDVNPSIEIITNRLDRVVEIKPLNNDARDLLEDFDPGNRNLESTVNDLVDLLILTGHIRGGEDNIVMITVKDDSVDSRLVNKVNQAIQAMLENKQIEATILNQAIASSDRDANQTGVQLAAKRIQEMDERLTAEEIESMTVKELIQYSNKNNIAIESLFRVVAGNINESTSSGAVISREKAKEIALAQVNGEIIKIELDDLHDDDDPEYEIKILADGVIYEIEIDAYTGRVVKFERDDDDDSEPGRKNNNLITEEEASRIALELADGEIVKLKLDDDDDDDDDPEYEIKVNKDGVIYEIKIDARTGGVEEFEIDDDDDDYRSTSAQKQQSKSETDKTQQPVQTHKPEQTQQPASTQQPKQTQQPKSHHASRERISADEAKAIALELTGGGRITDFELDDDEYEIEIRANGKEYEIEIDAYTGKVLDFDVEDDD
ncbi:MAG TPA: hypothetical protein GXZ29_04435 [Clostridiales bacterium]|jgi:uncharacterized membrane protein YkoI|nr:hypothetical protein [Clostridiales bacterium]